MNNFEFYNPTRILFGTGQIAAIAKEIPPTARVLVTYGGGSVFKNGTMDDVKAALAGRTVLEFGGIEPNPDFDTLMKAVMLARHEKIDFLLAVGGGSVIDGTKFIAAAIPFTGEPWDILAKHAPLAAAVPFGTVLTLPATGSEMNSGSVVSRKATQDKLFFGHPLVFPQFSILDPEKTYTLPVRQVGNGVVDAFVHVMEQYLTYPANAPLQDRFAEGILLTLIEEAPKLKTAPQDYNVRANIMWCATLALNGLIGAGVPQDWSTHMIGHEMTALHGLDHAQTLAIVLPATLRARRAAKREKLLQYAARVWGISTADENPAIEQAIERTAAFFRAVGLPTSLKDYGISGDYASPLLAQLKRHHMVQLGEKGDVTLDTVNEVLKLCA